MNIFLAPPTSNRRWQCIDHFLGGQLWEGIFVSFNTKNIRTTFATECISVVSGEWMLLGEEEYDYKQFSSINLMYFLCIIFTNADLKISLMDYIILSKLPCSIQQAGSKTPIV